MTYASKLLVIASMAGAIALETLVTAGQWATLVPLTVAAFLAAALLSVAFEAACAAIVLSFAYVVPALILVEHGKLLLYYGHVWSAALLGVMVPRSVRSGWSIPRPWAIPVVLWALTIALTWPVVALRELDFTPGLLGVIHLSNSVIGAAPPLAANGVADNTLAVGLGILWFDWLFGAFAEDEPRFRRSIIVGNIVSWAIATGVAIYQLFKDIEFLNPTLYGALGRASGTMLDANPLGVVAAAWGPACVAAAWLTTSRRLRGLAVCGLVASWLGLWASAARSAFGVGIISLLFLAYAAWVSEARRLSPPTRTRIATVGALASAALVLAVLFLPASSGPLPRLRGMLPTLSAASMTGFIEELWVRNGYGRVATYLIRTFPAFGVGLGSFHVIVPDYALQLTHTLLPPDNAQNWYRHQLVETGVVGSIGWVAWLVTFGWFVVSTRPPAATRFSATIVKGLIVSMAAIALFGIPTQTIAVAIAFWTFAFWYVALVIPGVQAPDLRPRFSARTWMAIWMIVASAVAGTLYTARNRLRVPHRAATFASGWDYFYGFSDAEPVLDVRRHSTVWARRHAVAVLMPNTRWVKLTVAVDRLNVLRGPVDVRVSGDGRSILETRIADDRPIVRYIELGEGRTRMMVETWVSRSIRPSDYGLPDRRELGLLIDWDFVAAPGPPLAVFPLKQTDGIQEVDDDSSRANRKCRAGEPGRCRPGQSPGNVRVAERRTRERRAEL